MGLACAPAGSGVVAPAAVRVSRSSVSAGADTVFFMSPPRGGSTTDRLQRELHAPFAVGPGAREPDVPPALGQLAGLLHFLLGRIDHGHAELRAPLLGARVPRGRVLPLLVLEAYLLQRVHDRLLEIPGQRVPRLLVDDEPFAARAGQVPYVIPFVSGRR